MDGRIERGRAVGIEPVLLELVIVRDLLQPPRYFEAVRTVERVRRDSAHPAVGLLDAFDFLHVEASGRIRAREDVPPDVRDLLGGDAPVQARLPVDVRDERGKVRNPTLELRQCHEIVVAEHVAPVQRGAATDVCPEAVGCDRQGGLGDEIERQLGMIRLDLAGEGDRRHREYGRWIFDDGRNDGSDPGAFQRRQCGRRRGQLHDRSALERANVVDRLNRVAAPGVDREHRAGRLLRDAERRAQRGDAADAREHIRHLRNGAVGEGQTIHVRDPARIAEEVDALPVGTPLRVDVFGAGEMRELPDLAPAPRVDDGQLVVAVGQLIQRRREAIGHERDQRTIGRPRRLEVGVGVIRQAPQLAAVEIVHEEIGDPSNLRAERDLFSVGRPGRIEDLAERRKFDLLHEVAVASLDDA